MNDGDLQENPEIVGETAPAVSDWPSPGQKLKKLREEMGLSHGRVADALHMTAHYVKALESDQYDKLPGKTFVKGYFRSYAKLLGADIEDVMTCYERYVNALEENQESEANVIRAKKAYDQNIRWMICAAVIILVVIGVSWYFANQKAATATMAETRNTEVAEVPARDDDAVTAEVLIATLAEEDVQPVQEAFALQSGESAVTSGADMTETALAAEDAAGSTEAGDAVPDNAEVVADVPEAVFAQEVDGIPAAPVIVSGADRVSEDSGIAGNQSSLPDYTVTELANSRQVQLESEGEDLLEIHFSGASWVEVDNGENTRLYNDMLRTGDDLTIRGKAPFNVLVGDANMVDMTFNSRAVDIANRMRSDNSARILLEPEAY